MSVYHPVCVMGPVKYQDGSFSNGWLGDPDDPQFGTTFHLHNRRKCPVWIHGVRALNPAWEVVLLSIGPHSGPYDVAAFNLDAVPGPPRHLYPTTERPRFVHYPLGSLEPDEKLPIRACTYGSTSFAPMLNLLFFVEEIVEEEYRSG